MLIARAQLVPCKFDGAWPMQCSDADLATVTQSLRTARAAGAPVPGSALSDVVSETNAVDASLGDRDRIIQAVSMLSADLYSKSARKIIAK